MRFGQNPAKFVSRVDKPERITVAVLSYVPAMSGFHAQSLDVLRACLKAIVANTEVPYDLMVFDNGSCREARDYLTAQLEAGTIQFLLLSDRNLGKGGAWNQIFSGAPGEIIAYADSDALVSKGWLKAALEILETYPRAGMVTSRPFRTRPEWYSSTIDWAEAEPQARVERGQFIAWEDFREFDMSLGQSEDEVRSRFNETEDIRVEYRGVCAQVGASHWQFVAYKSVLETVVPFDMEKPMGQVGSLDQKLNEAGYLRLMTCQPLAMNLSNTLVQPLLSKSGTERARRRPTLGRKIAELPLIRRALLFLYDAIFRLYFVPPEVEHDSPSGHEA